MPSDAALPVPRLDASHQVWNLPPRALTGWDGREPALATEARLGRVADRLVAAFRCTHRVLYSDPSLPRDRPVEGLWERDVVELFLLDAAREDRYLELEASPMGQWLVLAFDGIRRRSAALAAPPPRVEARIAAGEHRIVLELPLPDLPRRGRIGLFRIHGRPPAREHLAGRVMSGERPDFHQPSLWPSFEAL